MDVLILDFILDLHLNVRQLILSLQQFLCFSFPEILLAITVLVFHKLTNG